MIRLDQNDLQSMYPGMTEKFSARMGRMIHTLPTLKEEKQVKRIPARIILAAVLLLAALSTTAFALTRPAVLDWLLPSGSPTSTELESIAQDIHAEATADGVTARVTGVVYDGRRIAFSYEVENADPTQPVILALDSTFSINGEEHPVPHPAYTYNVRMVPSPHLDVLPAQRNPVTGGVLCDLPSGLTGQVECAVTFTVYRPQKGFAILNDPDSMLRDDSITDADTLAEIADSRATLESFRNAILIEDDAQDADLWSAQGYTVLSESGSPWFGVLDARSNLAEAARVTVPFTFDADATIFRDFSGAEAQLEDCTVQAVQFRLSPLTTYIHVRLIPTENTEEAARALAEKYGPCTLTDESGNPVEYSDMDYLYDNSPDITCVDGQWLCRYLLDMPGLLRFPQSVGFTVQTGDLLRFPLTN